MTSPDECASAPLAVGDTEPPSGDTAALLRTIHAVASRPVACPHCQGSVLWRWGCTGRGVQRWRCRDCRGSCSALTGTAICGIHELAKLETLIRDMARPYPQPCRSLAQALELDKSTVWRWRNRVSESLVVETVPTPIADRCRRVFRESRKASREWVRHAREPERFPALDRRQWVVYRRQSLPLPQPMTPYRIVVDCAAQADGRHRLTVLGSEALLEAARIGGAPASAAGDGPAAPRGRRSDGAPGQKACRSLHSGEAPTTGQAALGGHALCTFLRAFRGPATRHLAGYVAWLELRLGHSEAERCRILAARLLARPLEPAGGPHL